MEVDLIVEVDLHFLEERLMSTFFVEPRLFNETKFSQIRYEMCLKSRILRNCSVKDPKSDVVKHNTVSFLVYK